MTQPTRRIQLFYLKHPLGCLSLAVVAFVVCVVGASLYANAVVWNLATANGAAIGRGGVQSVTQTLVQYDGFQYTHIAQYGYTTLSYTAFLPLYPIAINAIARLTHLSVDWSALAVSWLALLAAAAVVYKWAEHESKLRKQKLSPWVVLGLLAIFPTSFYMALPYTESLFIFLNVGALLLFRKQRYVPAGVLASLAAATRFQGFLLAAYFAFDYWFDKQRPRDWHKLIAAVVGVLGLVAYMLYLRSHFGNPLEFMLAEKGWGRLNGGIFTNLVHSMRPLYLWFIAVLAVGLWSMWQYLGMAYFSYGLLFVLLPLSSGRLDSINRYMLSLVPMFFGLGLWGQRLPKVVRLGYVVTSTFLLAWSILLFANGYWVA